MLLGTYLNEQFKIRAVIYSNYKRTLNYDHCICLLVTLTNVVIFCGSADAFCSLNCSSELHGRSASCSALLTPADSNTVVAPVAAITIRGSDWDTIWSTLHFKQVKLTFLAFDPAVYYLSYYWMKNNICKWQSNGTSADILPVAAGGGISP